MSLLLKRSITGPMSGNSLFANRCAMFSNQFLVNGPVPGARKVPFTSAYKYPTKVRFQTKKPKQKKLPPVFLDLNNFPISGQVFTPTNAAFA